MHEREGRTGSLCEDGALLRPKRLLDRRPTLSLNERSLDLPVVDRRIERFANIHVDVDAENSTARDVSSSQAEEVKGRTGLRSRYRSRLRSRRLLA